MKQLLLSHSFYQLWFTLMTRMCILLLYHWNVTLFETFNQQRDTKYWNIKNVPAKSCYSQTCPFCSCLLWLRLNFIKFRKGKPSFMSCWRSLKRSGAHPKQVVITGLHKSKFGEAKIKVLGHLYGGNASSSLRRLH